MSKRIRKGGWDQYGPERFAELIFATVRKSGGLKGLKAIITVQLDYSVQQ